MKFPKVNKQPDELLCNDERRLSLSKRIALDILLVVSILFRPAVDISAHAATSPSQDPKLEPHSSETKIKLVRIGKHLRPFLNAINPARYFAHSSHSSHASHSSHVSHASHASHASHYSSSPSPPPPPPPSITAPSVSLGSPVVSRLTVQLSIMEQPYVPTHDTHVWRFGDGRMISQPHAAGHSVTYTYTAGGTYMVTVELRQTGSIVGIATTTVTVTAAALPVPAEQGAVVVAGQVVLVIRFPAGGFSVQERVAQVQQRIADARTDGPIRPEDVAIRMVGSDPVIFVRSTMIITIDRYHAQANHTTQLALARIWLANFRRALPLL